MRIVYLHQHFITPDMPGGTRSYEMSRRWVAAGHDVHVVTGSWDGAWHDAVEIVDGINVHCVAVPYSHRMGDGARMRSFVRFAVKAARIGASISGDVVFATSTPLTIALPAVWLKRRGGVPMVFEVRDLWPGVPIALGLLKGPTSIAAARWLERFAYRNADRVIALSPGMARAIARCHYPEERISVVPNACDIDHFCVDRDVGQSFLRENPELSGGPLVVYAGTVGRVNGVEYLAQIAAEMMRLDGTIRFLVVGHGQRSNELADAASRAGVLGRNFWIHPPVPKLRVPAVLSAASVVTSLFIDVPALWDNSANKFFDGLAAGRPLMINYEGWQAEILRKSGAGIVVPPAAPGEAALSLHRFLTDRGCVGRASAAAWQIARERFDRDRLSSSVLSVIEGASAGA